MNPLAFFHQSYLFFVIHCFNTDSEQRNVNKIEAAIIDELIVFIAGNEFE